MGIQGQILIIDRRGVSTMSIYSLTSRVTHLTLDGARIVMGYS
jgi:hypothetical protein